MAHNNEIQRRVSGFKQFGHGPYGDRRPNGDYCVIHVGSFLVRSAALDAQHLRDRLKNANLRS